MSLTPLFPRQQVPALSIPTVGGGTFTLADQSPENFTLVVFYRGLHCPICAMYLGSLNKQIEEFEKRGVTVIVASTDTEERAAESKEKWKLDKLTLGYGVTLENAREWGLFISTSRGKTSTGHMEPDLFAEPGLFLVRPNGELYFSSVQTMPFSRPRFEDILPALESDSKFGRDFSCNV
jgi:peroxiredoxin